MDEYKGPIKFWYDLFPHILAILICIVIVSAVVMIVFFKVNSPEKMLAEIDRKMQDYDPRGFLTIPRSQRDNCIEWALGKDWFDIKWNDRGFIFRELHPELDPKDFSDATEIHIFWDRVSKAWTQIYPKGTKIYFKED